MGMTTSHDTFSCDANFRRACASALVCVVGGLQVGRFGSWVFHLASMQACTGELGMDGVARQSFVLPSCVPVRCKTVVEGLGVWVGMCGGWAIRHGESQMRRSPRRPLLSSLVCA